MNKKIIIIILILLSISLISCSAKKQNNQQKNQTFIPEPNPVSTNNCTKWYPGHYALLNKPISQEQFEQGLDILGEDIIGVEIGISWRQLEPEKDIYNFSLIEDILKICEKHNKFFFLAIEGRLFGTTERPIPDYLYEDPIYSGGAEPFRTDRKGTTVGSMARLWDINVLERHNNLVSELGKRFDKEPYFAGIRFGESALAVELNSSGLTEESYMHALKEIMRIARGAFPSSVVVQQINWGYGSDEDNKRQMGELANYSYQVGAGIGGPDVYPDHNRPASKLRVPAYDFYPEYAGKMPLCTDVQGPEFSKEYDYTLDDFYDMGVNTLKLNYMFWVTVEDKKNARYSFTKDIIPFIKKKKGYINKECPENIKPCCPANN